MIQSAGYLRQVKQTNLSGLLKQIWKLEPISRIELVEAAQLTSGTITNLTQDLLQVGLLKESGLSTGTVGRKRMMLKLNTERFALVGIDIGRESLEVVATDLSGKILASTEASTLGISGPQQVLEQVSSIVQSMIARVESEAQQVLGIGLGIPGPMNMQDGTLLMPPNFPNWEHFPVKAELERLLGRKVLMHDDARTSALAERWFGYGREHTNFVYVTMGHGIGGGVVSGGDVILGSNGLYGQIGHITIIPDGELCACGNRGCWETVGSIPAILRRWGHGNVTDVTIGGFFEAVDAGDPGAMRVLESTLQVLESTLTTLFNVYDPDLIILGGKLYAYIDNYLPRLRNHVQSSVYRFAQSKVAIQSASFGTSQSAVGAAALVFGELMNYPLDVLEQVTQPTA